jgi:hypothetical protein
VQGLLLAWGLAGCGALGCGVIGLEPRLGADAGEVDRCTEASAVDWASTPMPTDRRDGLPNPVRRTVAADGATVRDEVTGLTWQRAAGPRTGWAEAAAYCAGLELAGCDAWRLPARIELASLVDHTTYDPTIDLAVFPATDTTAWWWSATPGPSTSAWVVNFLNGNSFTEDLSVPGHVRCVRGGGDGAGPAAAVPGRRRRGRRRRDRVDPGSARPIRSSSRWPPAQAQCAASSLDGGGWRVPVIGELQSLSALTGAGAAATIDPVRVPGHAARPDLVVDPDPRPGQLGHDRQLRRRDGQQLRPGRTRLTSAACVDPPRTRITV